MKIDIILQKKQKKAFQASLKIPVLFYGGARGGGKSYLVRARELYRRLKYPGTKGLIVRKTYPELLSNHIRMFWKEYPMTKDWFKQSEKAIYWPNGSITEFSYLKNTADVYTYQGREYEDISIDEITQHEEIVFKMLRGSNRTTNKDIKPSMFLTGNPGGIGHGWVKRMFVDRDFEPNERPEEFDFVQAKVYDNDALMEADPDYLKRLQDLPDETRRAWLEGDWDVFVGQVFDEFRRDKHVTRRVIPKNSYSHFLWLDWGYSGRENHKGAFAGLAAALVKAKHDGQTFNRVIVYREWYGKYKYPHEWAEIIYNQRPVSKFRSGYADPAMFNTQTDGSKAISKLMQEKWTELNGDRMWLTLKPGGRNRIARVATVHNWLSIAPDGLPYMLITEACPHLIRTLPLLVYDEHRVEDVDTNTEDHCLTGDTLILTDSGWRYLKDIPYARITGYDRMVMDIKVSSGRIISCTKDHKVLTMYGWKEAGQLKIGEEILLLSQIPFKNSLAGGSTNAESTTAGSLRSSREVNDYIERSGSFTTVPFQRVTPSTTLMETQTTTASQTSSSLKKESIQAYIPLTPQINKEKQEGEMRSNLQHLVMQSSQGNNVVERVSWVGNERRVGKVYDLGVEHPSHCFVANGFVVHNCYDALGYGLSAIRFLPAKLGGFGGKKGKKKALPEIVHDLDLDAFEKAKPTGAKDWRV